MGSINFPVQRLLPVALLAAVAIASAQYVDDFDTEALFARKLIEKQRKVLPKNELLSELHVVNSPGHSPSRTSRLDATRFLLDFLA